MTMRFGNQTPADGATRTFGRSALLGVCSLCVLLAGPALADGTGKTLRIMMVGPLTGDAAEVGRDIIQGAQLAVTYVNDKGGISAGPMQGARLAIEPQDDQLSSKAASALGAQYLSDDGIWTMGGFLSSGVALAAAQVAARGKLSVFTTSSGANYLTDKPPHNVLTQQALGSGYAKAAFEFAVRQLHAKKVGIIAGDYSYLDSGYPAMDESSKRLGVPYEKQVFPTSGGGTQDFSPYLTTLQHSDVDVILLGANEGEAARLIKQARQLGLKQPFIDISGTGYHETFIKVAGVDGIGAISEESPALLAPPGSFPAQMEAAYQQRFGRQMTSPALLAFDAVLSIEAVTAAGARDRTDMLAHATEAHGTGLQGPIGYGSDFRPLEVRLGFAQITGPGLADRRIVGEYRLLDGGAVEAVK